ncbi:MAG: hypothetical protein LBS29_04215 [Endomicrobium sp.]|jgi:hypothetical protein|nr:hypothetical protein [Endomicrobium sp.]
MKFKLYFRDSRIESAEGDSIEQVLARYREKGCERGDINRWSALEEPIIESNYCHSLSKEWSKFELNKLRGRMKSAFTDK